MALVMSVIALLGLIVFAVGGVLFLVGRPAQPRDSIIMVIGGLIFAVAQIVLLFDVIF